MNTARIRTIAILGIITIILSAISFWVYNNSFVSVAVSGAADTQLTYLFTNQKSGKVTSVTSTQSTIKKRLPRGSYNIQVNQNDTSFVSTASSPGFLRTTQVQGPLTTERARSFVGNNPSPCVFYNGVLYSFACAGPINQINKHVPATASSATYVLQPFKNTYGDGRSTITPVGEKLYALAQAHTDTAYGTYHLLEVAGDGSLHDLATLSDLATTASYQIAPFRSGFVVYDKGFETFLYYATPQSKPENITIEKPKDQSLTGVAVKTSGDTIMVAYSAVDKNEISDGGNKVPTKNEIVIYRNGATTHSSLKDLGAVLEFCGTNKICILSDNNLEVYGLEKNKPAYLYSYSDVRSLSVRSADVLLSQADQLVSLNVDSRKGYVAYSFGGYQWCGQQSSGNNIILCLTNAKNAKVALLIDPQTPVASPIDKQILDLQKQAEVTSVSVYKNFIYIIPNYGRTVFVPSLGSFGYDPAVVKAVNKKINDAVKALNIDLSTYTISGLAP